MAERRDRWGRYRGEDDLELAVAEAMPGEEVRVGRGGAEALAPQEEGGAGGGHGWRLPGSRGRVCGETARGVCRDAGPKTRHRGGDPGCGLPVSGPKGPMGRQHPVFEPSGIFSRLSPLPLSTIARPRG